MKKTLKWLAIGFVGLLVLGAIVGNDAKKDPATTPAKKPAPTGAVTSPATTTADAPVAAEPISVAADGPYETTHDQVTLTGSVSPRGSKVRVNGTRASVNGGRWSKLVQITKKGDNSFEVVGSKPGHDKDTTTVTVTRKLTAAEKAAVQAAERQAFIAQAATISYAQLLAHPSRYKGKKVVYRGKIFQVQEDTGSTVILLSVTDQGYGFWDDHIWVDYDGTIKGAEGDMMTVYGTLTGTQDYDTQIGGNTTVPSIRAKYILE
jgi:Glucodextranase, domain B